MANRNVASGDWSFVGGGQQNTASGIASVIAGGGYYASNSASGSGSAILGGAGNSAGSSYASVLGGRGGNANQNNSTIVGGYGGLARAIIGYTVFSSHGNPLGSGGNSQGALSILAKQTTDATATVLTSDTNSASTTNQVILPNNSAYYFKATVIANVTGGGNTKAWTLEGAIKRGSGVGTAAIVGTVTTTVIAADLGAATWTVTATADTTNGGLAITFTGQASTTIRVVARVDTTEVTF